MNEHNPDDRSAARELRRDEREVARARRSADEQATHAARERRAREDRETTRIIALDDALQDQEAAADAPGAAGCLSPALREGLDAAALSDFFGPFTGVRPFFFEPDVVGLTLEPARGAVRCRRFRFLLDGDGRIDNIEEADPDDEL